MKDTGLTRRVKKANEDVRDIEKANESMRYLYILFNISIHNYF